MEWVVLRSIAPRLRSQNSTFGRLTHVCRNGILHGSLCVKIGRWSNSGGFRNFGNKSHVIALLIDGDHLGPSSFKPMLDKLSLYGSIPIRRVYINSLEIQRWKTSLADLNIEPVEVARSKGGAKDPADMAMALDAAEVRFVSSGVTVTALAVASNDADFAILLHKVRSWGLMAISLFRDLGHPSMSRQKLEDASDVFLTYGLSAPKRFSARAVINTNVLCSGLQVSEDGIPGTPDIEQENHVKEILAQYGYLSRFGTQQITGPLRAALAKFYHTNQMGNLSLMPFNMAIEEMFGKLAKHKHRQWKQNPGNLVFIEPESSSTPGKGVKSMSVKRYIQGPAPFFCEVGPHLVDIVLSRMGFLDGDLLDEAILHFCEINSKPLQRHGIEATDAISTKRKKLHGVFSCQNKPQLWRSPHLDSRVRKHLVALGRLQDIQCSRDELLRAMQKLLQEEANLPNVPSSYPYCVTKAVWHLNRNDPRLRK